MRDLICDVIKHCASSFATGTIKCIWSYRTVNKNPKSTSCKKNSSKNYIICINWMWVASVFTMLSVCSVFYCICLCLSIFCVLYGPCCSK